MINHVPMSIVKLPTTFTVFIVAAYVPTPVNRVVVVPILELVTKLGAYNIPYIEIFVTDMFVDVTVFRFEIVDAFNVLMLAFVVCINVLLDIFELFIVLMLAFIDCIKLLLDMLELFKVATLFELTTRLGA